MGRVLSDQRDLFADHRRTEVTFVASVSFQSFVT